MKLSQFDLKTINVKGVNYAYVEEGEGNPIVFLHGFPDHAGSWDHIVDELKESYTCLAPFLKGYFPTDMDSKGNYSVRILAEEIHQLMQLKGYETYAVVGHDWGGSIAYVLANLYPDSVTKICVLNIPHPKFLKPSLKLLYKSRHMIWFMNKKKAPDTLKKNNYAYLEKLYKRWSPNLNYSVLKEQMAYWLSKEGRKEAVLGYYQMLGKETEENKLIYFKLPRVPGLIMVGKKDGSVDLSQFYKMNNESCFIMKYDSSSGHFIHRENPAFVLKELNTFLHS